MRERVAPVLNWCSQVALFPKQSDKEAKQELQLAELKPSEWLRLLRDKGVDTLVCGALSPDLHNEAKRLGFRVICGIAGSIEEVLGAYRNNHLDRPEFWLPGCNGARRYRQRLGENNCPSCKEGQRGERAMPGGKGGKGAGRGQGRGQGGRCVRGGGGSGATAGPATFCVCPACGAKAPHERGIPCFQVNCPQCAGSKAQEGTPTAPLPCMEPSGKFFLPEP
jgi:predicted Fe-Mo cluster-binding NifX family protein